jgi:geranylgeranyl pyrophosphate synthase
MEGVDVDQLVRAMAKPLREITDRGGKAWRSYAALLCCDVAGGDSRKYIQWLAMPEFLHVGSLIVDDVEDGSGVRRGGPTCHELYGVPIAINTGTAAYFMGQKLLFSEDASAETRVRLYDLYFEAMRAGHAGQAMDLDGFDDAVEAAVETGDAGTLERRLSAMHRLKTAAPAAALARMGALVGGGTEERVEGLGRYFESLGMSFQIVDDALNLRGFKGELKTVGEDISAGHVTYPFVKAMAKLGPEDRRWLWDVVKSRTGDRDVVASAIAKLEECGALEECLEQARDVVEEAWRKVDPVLDDSIPKIMLRAFSWYLLERQY